MVASTRASPLPAVHKTGVWWATASGRPGGVIHINPTVVAKHLMLEFGSASEVFSFPSTGVISGVVRNGAIPVEFAKVVLFHRGTSKTLASVRTNSAGEFSFSGLYPFAGAYFVTAFNDAEGTSFNAQILDRLTPA